MRAGGFGLICCFVCLCVVWNDCYGNSGNRRFRVEQDSIAIIQAPLSPEASMELIELPEGFSVELFASEPDIGKPIAMEWDERGRLWIIETVDYPNTVSGQPAEGDDRILICEDTDGDGKADKFKVFAAGLDIPTSFAFVQGGIIVAQAPHFLLLRDLDGDDIADTREIVMTGWGIFDTHAGPSNLQYGLDNKLWGTVGYSGFDGHIGGKPVTFRQGAFRFGRDVCGGVKDFEYLATTSNNTWGLGFSEEFDVFISCTNNEHSVFLGIPKQYYANTGLHGPGIEKIDSHYQIHPLVGELHQLDVQGGFTAATGHAFYTARSFPREYWNRTAFICEPTGRLVHKHVVAPSGSGFVELGDGKNILASSDSWFSPVGAKVGPDGALWVLDWYNFMIQHTPQEQKEEVIPGRDLFRGRIYRVVYKQSKPTAMPEVSVDRPASLLEALQSDNMFWRITAQRLIVQSNLVGMAEQLFGLIEENTVDEVHTNGPALHAIWTLSGLGLLDGSDQRCLDVILTALKHQAPGVRKAAVQVLPVHIPFVADRLLVSGILEDPDNRVRLAGYLALTDAKSTPGIGRAIFSATNDVRNTEDKWISQALKILAQVHNQVFQDEYIAHFDPLAWGASDSMLIHQLAATPTTHSDDFEKEDSLQIDQVVSISARLGELLYDKQSFTVKAGSNVKIEFSNPNYTQHNLVIIKPGTLEPVREAAAKLARGSRGGELQYVPNTEDILFASSLVNPNERCELIFIAPSVAGRYPFLCTFPGHSETMHGIMNVTE
ncbi:PVC-type heme-binding CxxCH protein [Parapedobacter pyrenivorans]|uniref:PVC-type heme-binding CxxCH protein n=1 Tax=Parapedobacter pyrenivorans TaxID=1305674 RepID=UPI003DA7204E